MIDCYVMIPVVRKKLVIAHTLIDAEDYDVVAKYTWRWHKSGTGYVTRYSGTGRSQKTLLLHRVLHKDPKGMDIDHINGNGFDNRRCNLQVVSHANNQKNRRLNKNNKSGFKGVHWDKREQKYRAEIKCHKKHYWLGYFDVAVNAAEAYNDAAMLLFGEYACLNHLP